MTATEVDGIKVVEVNPVKSGLWKPEKPVFYTHTMELLLEDSRVVYGCGYCEYTAEKPGTIRVHQKHYCEVAPNSQANPNSANHNTPVDDTSLAELIGKLLDQPGPDLKAEVAKLRRDNTQLKQQLGKWRDRALAAEKALAPFRALIRKINE